MPKINLPPGHHLVEINRKWEKITDPRFVKYEGRIYPGVRYHKTDNPRVVECPEDDYWSEKHGYSNVADKYEQALDFVDAESDLQGLTHEQIRFYAKIELALEFPPDLVKRKMIMEIVAGRAELEQQGIYYVKEIPGNYENWQMDIAEAIKDPIMEKYGGNNERISENTL